MALFKVLKARLFSTLGAVLVILSTGCGSQISQPPVANGANPVANDANLITHEDTPVSTVLMGSDVNGDSLSYEILSQPLNGTLSGSGASWTYTPTANFNGTDLFTFKANDGEFDSNPASVSIQVNPVNDAPVADSQTVSATSNVAIAITLTGSDIEGDNLTFAISQSPANGQLTGTLPNLSYTPNPDFTGNDNFTFSVNDGILSSAVTQVDISVIADLDKDGIPDNLDPDIDGDGIANAQDVFPTDPNESSDLDADGIGDNADTDRDGDGVDNSIDAFPDDSTETHDIDADGVGNNTDTDRDGDGVDNALDAFPDDSTETSDLDNDGIGDNIDTDRDGDGIVNNKDYFPDDSQAFSVPTVTITSPNTLVTVGSSPVAITGTISDPDATLTVNGVVLAHSNGTFSADVALEEGANSIIVRALDQQNHEGTATISVSLDKTAPYITIDSPIAGETVYKSSITVSGLVNDIVRGTVSETEAQVTVNNVDASVSNRSYLAEDVPLIIGSNTLTITAADAVGNVATATTTVIREVPQTNVISIISGQGQAANIQSTLTDPLTVRLMSDGQPTANQKIVFRVIQGNGVFPSTPNESNSAVVTTDSKGEATISYQLGSRSGNGNHRVRASAVGYEGEVIFYATANAAAGVRIGVVEGNNQRGSVRQPLPKPFTVAVTDEGANLIPNASVTFTVTEGSGRFTNGEATISVLTDNDGRASAGYILGPEQGIDVQRIIASLSTSSSTAGFTASAFMPGDPGKTSISGVVLDNQDDPVPDVTIRIEGSTRQAVSNAQGQFIITEAPVGPVHLLVEGSTTSRSGEWPSLSYNIVTVPGVVNPLASPIYLVELDMKNAVTVGEVDTIVTHPELPGFALDVAAGSVTFPNGSKTGRISISRVNANKVPMTPPNGVQPQLIITIQPHGATFDPPAPLTVPNTDGIKPLSEIEMFSYDHDLEEFVTIGLGVVSKDGRTITSKSGSGVIKAGWHFPSAPNDVANAGSGGDPTNTGPSCDSSNGCPTWSVSMESLNLTVTDTPLWYDSPIGPNVNIRLINKSKSVAHNTSFELRNTDPVLRAFIEDSELFGNRWNFSYTSGILITASEAIVLMPDGRREAYTLTTAATGELTPVNKDAYDRLYKDNAQQYRLVKRNGKVIEYHFVQTPTKLFMTRYSDINGDSLTFDYNANGLMSTITDALGRVTNFEYATVGSKQVNGKTAPIKRVNKVTDPFGRTALFGYDASLNLTEITDMANYKSTLSYDSNLNISSITRPQFGTWLFKIEPKQSILGDNSPIPAYPAPGAPMGPNERLTITDPNDNKTEYYFDAAAKQNWKVLPNHYKEYETSELSNKNQPKEIYTFKHSNHGWSRITSTTDEAGNKDSRTYHSTGLLRSKQYQNGTSDFYTYNEANQLITKIVAKGTAAVKRFEYEYLEPESLNITKETGPSIAAGQRKQTLTEYDDNKNTTQITRHGFRIDSAGNTQAITRQQQLTYNANNQILSINGERTDVTDETTFSYYNCNDASNPNCGQLQTITNAAGQVTTFNHYTSSGLVSRITDANGLVTNISYDGLQRVIRVEQYDTNLPANKRTTTLSYQGAKQNIASSSSANGYVLTYSYDNAERLTQVSDNLGYRTRYTYDKTGNQIEQETFGDNSGNETLQRQAQNTLNQINLITEVNTAGSVSKATLDGYGNPQTTTDPNLNPDTEYQYDALYRLTRIKDRLGHTTQYQYNVKDQIIQVRTDNNAITRYEYDDFGETTKEQSPDRGTIHYQYDNAGNTTQITDGRGITSNYSYDVLNRLIAATYPNNTENIGYSYDSCTNGTGRLCQITDKTGTTTFAYDVYGNITTHTKVELGNSYTTTYTYDNVNQVISMTYPSGITVNYQRDQRSRVTGITLADNSLTNGSQNILSDIQYRADDQPLQMTLGNGLAETRSYDLQGRLTTQQLDTWLNKTYRYDANGNVTEIDTQNTDLSYQYDALDRIESESGQLESSYSYDQNSNRLDQQLSGSTTDYQYKTNSNQLTQVGSTALTLDASGNTITDGNKQYSYNNRNQLTSYIENTTTIASYEYNHANLRTQKTLGTTTHLYHHDLQGRRIQHDSNNSTATIWLGWQPVAHIKLATNGDIQSITYLTGDQIGTPRLGTNQTQQVVWRWDSGAFGSAEPTTDVDGDSTHIHIENRFAGQYADAESGLRYNWNRYYDANTGRYVSSDPIGLKGGLNTFTYVGGNPVGLVDPDGKLAVNTVLGLLNGTISAIATMATASECSSADDVARDVLVSFALGFGTGFIGGVGTGIGGQAFSSSLRTTVSGPGAVVASVLAGLNGSAATGIAGAASSL